MFAALGVSFGSQAYLVWSQLKYLRRTGRKLSNVRNEALLFTSRSLLALACIQMAFSAMYILGSKEKWVHDITPDVFDYIFTSTFIAYVGCTVWSMYVSGLKPRSRYY
jgi:hypothetical protein